MRRFCPASRPGIFVLMYLTRGAAVRYSHASVRHPRLLGAHLLGASRVGMRGASAADRHPARRPDVRACSQGGPALRRQVRVEVDRGGPEPRHHRHCGGRTLSHPARSRRRRPLGCHQGDVEARHLFGRPVRRRRLFHPDLLRPVRAADHSPRRRPLPGGGTRRLHELFGRTQCRRQRLHGRRGSLPDLFGARVVGGRSRQGVLHRRPHLLARQCHRAGARHRLCAGSRLPDRPAAALDQPYPRLGRPSRSWSAMWRGSGRRRVWSGARTGK